MLLLKSIFVSFSKLVFFRPVVIFFNFLVSEGTLEFSDDERFLRYEGQVKDGKPWGLGNMTFSDGGVYSGNWKAGRRNGHGIQTYSANSKKESYDGSWKNDVEHGSGVLVYKNGEKYVGNLSNGKRDGSGEITFAENDEYNRVRYDGDWKEDMLTGNGTMIWKSGVKYVGQWLNNKNHGYGVRHFANNSKAERYEGDWRQRRITGFGTLIWKNGDKYVGQWKDFERSGKGTYFWADGRKYVGEWLNDLKNGFGILSFVENCTIKSYDGEWKEGKMSGHGSMVWRNGEKYVGEWRDNKATGQGTYYRPDGTKQSGELPNSLFHGNGNGDESISKLIPADEHRDGVSTIVGECRVGSELSQWYCIFCYSFHQN